MKFFLPVRDSVEGEITFNAPTVYQGASFDRVHLKFEGGRITHAEGTNNAHLNAILDADVGARYIGEFAIAFNPLILEPMRDILFDEKIAGSFHLLRVKRMKRQITVIVAGLGYGSHSTPGIRWWRNLF